MVVLVKAGDHIYRHVWSRWRIRRLLAGRRKLFIEFGAGNKKGQGGWITVDAEKNCDICWDLRKGIPFPNDSISKIYSYHFLEHLSFKDGRQFLLECRRVLIPGGFFSICVPNARLYIEAYLGGDQLDETRYLVYRPAFNNTTRIDYVNHIAYMDGQHKYMFDEENLLHVLKLTGFKNVRSRRFDRALDLEERDANSIYAEAEK